MRFFLRLKMYLKVKAGKAYLMETKKINPLTYGGILLPGSCVRMCLKLEMFVYTDFSIEIFLYTGVYCVAWRSFQHQTLNNAQQSSSVILPYHYFSL